MGKHEGDKQPIKPWSPPPGKPSTDGGPPPKKGGK